MANCGVEQFGYSTYNGLAQTCVTVGVDIYPNYRGHPRDAQFFATMNEGGVVIEPVFKAVTAISAIGAFQRACYNYESEWFLEHEIDESFDGLLAHFRELDSQLKPGMEMMLAQMHLKGKSPGSVKSETSSPRAKSPVVGQIITDVDRPESPDAIAIEVKKAKGGRDPTAIPQSQMFLREQRAIITRVLEEEPEWVSYVAELLSLKGNPLEQKDEIARLAQLIMQRLRALDPTLLPYYATDQTRVPQMMRAVAYLLREFSAYTTGHDSTQLMMRMSEGCRSVARTYEVGEKIFDSITYSQVHNRQLPAHVDPEAFNQGIRLGLTVGDMVFTRDAEHLSQLLEQTQKALDQKITEETAEGKEFVYRPEKQEVEGIIESLTWYRVGPKEEEEEATLLDEIPLIPEEQLKDIPQDEYGLPILPDEPKTEHDVLETRPETMVDEPIPDEEKETIPFGGDQPLQDAGEEDQPQSPVAATTVAETSAGPARISFIAQQPQEES
jgi:hypothetical protein